MTGQHDEVGGDLGHWFRRATHVLMCLVPLLYYPYHDIINEYLYMSSHVFLLLVMAVVLLLELLRLSRGWTTFGQHPHEAHHLSSFSWGVVGIVFVLIFAPGKQYGIPIIWACAFIDPLLGELRLAKVPTIWVTVLGLIGVAIIWLIAFWWLGTPWWWVLVMPWITIAAEKPNFQWVDDNALMMLVPLALVLLTKLVGVI